MPEYSLNQSSWGRAKQDTISAFHTISFWVVEIISSPLVAVGMYFAIPSFVSTFIKTVVPLAASSIWMLAVLSGVFLLSLVAAPYKQRNEARQRYRILADERIPNIVATPIAGKPASYERVSKTAWAELKIKNTSSDVSLEDVSVQIAELTGVFEKQDERGVYFLHEGYPAWNPSKVYWSEGSAPAKQFSITIPPGATEYALIAFHPNLGSGLGTFNTPTYPPMLESKIAIEVSSPNTRTWRGEFYIEYHPSGRDEFEFEEWDSWCESHNVIGQSTLDKGDSQTE